MTAHALHIDLREPREDGTHVGAEGSVKIGYLTRNYETDHIDLTTTFSVELAAGQAEAMLEPGYYSVEEVAINGVMRFIEMPNTDAEYSALQDLDPTTLMPVLDLDMQSLTVVFENGLV